jgi:dehydrogenase/reductase SDR family member 12
MPVFRTITGPIIRTPAQGADTIVWLGAAAEPLADTGRFWHDRRPRPTQYRFRCPARLGRGARGALALL